MAKICQRKGQRYTTKTSDVVYIETRPSQILEGQLIDESRAGICVAIDGERPALAPNQKLRVRCRTGQGKAKVTYLTEVSPDSFRIGIKWD